MSCLVNRAYDSFIDAVLLALLELGWHTPVRSDSTRYLDIFNIFPSHFSTALDVHSLSREACLKDFNLINKSVSL